MAHILLLTAYLASSINTNKWKEKRGMDEPTTYIKTGHIWKFRPLKEWWGKKRIKHRNNHIKKVINDKWDTFKKYLSTGKI
jgi:hypothetical protein